MLKQSVTDGNKKKSHMRHMAQAHCELSKFQEICFFLTPITSLSLCTFVCQQSSFQVLGKQMFKTTKSLIPQYTFHQS